MYPHERSLARHLADKPFAIIGVNSDRDLASIRTTCVEKNITWRSFWNGEKGTGGPISKKWNVRGWPTTYLIDKDGVIRFKNVRGESLDKAITELMAEMGEEVSLVSIDHEAEDKVAMAKLKEDAKAKDKAESEDKAEPEEDKKDEKPEDAKKKDDDKTTKADDSGDDRKEESQPSAKGETKAADTEDSETKTDSTTTEKDSVEEATDKESKTEKDSTKDEPKKAAKAPANK